MTQTSRYPVAGQLFALDTARHTMTVAHDDGLYRHLKFRAPGTSLYWFDLVTWPGALCFNGDMGTYTFARVPDMIDFFSGPGDINPGYWGEKVQGNGDARDKGVKAFSIDMTRQHVADLFREYADDHGWPMAVVRDLWAALSEDVLDVLSEYEPETRQALDGYVWTPMEEPDDELPALPSFRLADTWEWELADFKHAFLYACFAVQWGVNQYLAARGDTDFPARLNALPPVPRIQQMRERTGEQPRQLKDPVAVNDAVTSQPKEQYL